jgi:hypothetical protein
MKIILLILFLSFSSFSVAEPLYFKCDSVGEYDDYVRAGLFPESTPKKLIIINNIPKNMTSGVTDGKVFSLLSFLWKDLECEFSPRSISCVTSASLTWDSSQILIYRNNAKDCSFSTRLELEEIASKVTKAVMEHNKF